MDAYNRPGRRFRSAQFVVLIVIAWTALFHAIFYKRNEKPWYRLAGSGQGKATRYARVDGDAKHWDLAECLRKYHQSDNPPERANIEFLLGLRNKIEHRHLPELDASLFGECQASLLNLESLIVREFGERFALAEELAVSLQFSHSMPPEKTRAAGTMVSSASKSVRDFVERFRGSLPVGTLNDMRYSFSVFLVPKVVNRQSAADAAVEFVRLDQKGPEELESLARLNVLIREKHVPVANLNLLKPSEVVAAVRLRVPPEYGFNLARHTDAWKAAGVRPASGSSKPDQTDSRYCVYDKAHRDYLYTVAWVDRLVREVLAGEL